MSIRARSPFNLRALVLRIFEELLGLIILDDLVRVDKEYPLNCIVQAVDGQGNRDLERDIATMAEDLGTRGGVAL